MQHCHVKAQRMKYLIPSAMLFSMSLCGCAPGKGPQLMIELCVQGDQGVAEFMSEMRSITASEHMTFVDGGAQTQSELKAVGAKFEKLDTRGSVINFGVDRGDHTMIMGGNLGLPAYQIVVGFSGVEDHEEISRLADVVVKQLSTTWRVQRVPAGTGALPMKACPGKI
jgi:hypothetical protein